MDTVYTGSENVEAICTSLFTADYYWSFRHSEVVWLVIADVTSARCPPLTTGVHAASYAIMSSVGRMRGSL